MAKPLKDVNIINDDIQKCVRCGKCRTVCPIFREMRTENYTPRGMVYLVDMIRTGKLKPTPEIEEKFGNCLMCENCSSQCPSGIKVHEYVAFARAYMEDVKPNRIKRLIFRTVWGSNNMLDLLHLGLNVYQRTGLRTLIGKTGLLNKEYPILGDMTKAESMLPIIPKKTARKMIKEITPAKGKKKMTVGYFLGCGVNLFYPQVTLATIDVLTRNGCEVISPDIKCCGRPQMANSQLDVVTGLAKYNIEAFANLNVDYIISDCGSCSSTLKEHEHYVVPFIGTPLEAKAKEFIKKIIDVNAFLVDVLKITPEGLGAIPKTLVTYHDPCHLVRAQKITQQPRKVLKMIPGVEFVEMTDADKCCGGAGTFGATHYKLSQKIIRHKINGIKGSKAQVLATCCPTCNMQLSAGIKNNDMNVPIMHPVELLSQSYQAGEKEKAGKKSSTKAS